VTVRPHQHQRAFVEFRGLAMLDAMHRKRHPAALRGALDRRGRPVGECQQHEAFAEQVERRPAVR
jgi:hypothetical protein